jgi:hypothetical protein
MEGHGRPLQRIFKRLTSSQDQLEADELLEGTQERGATPINRCGDRERVPGIEPGRVIVADGRITYQQGGPVIYNPRYELRPVGAA